MEATYIGRSAAEEKALISLFNYRTAAVEEVRLFAQDLKEGVKPDMMAFTIDHLLWTIEMIQLVESKLQGPFVKIGDGSFDFDDIKIFRKTPETTKADA